MSLTFFVKKLTCVSGILAGICFFSEPLVAGVQEGRNLVQQCRHHVYAQEYRCTIKSARDLKATKGQQVLLFDRNNNWVATGEITSVSSEYFTANFLNASTSLYRAVEAKVDSSERMVFEWSDSFGRP